MRVLVLVGGLALLVGCKSQKKAASEYEAYLQETSGSTEQVDMEKGKTKEISDADRTAEKDSETAWPGSPQKETKIVVKEEEASLLSGEDGSMGNSKYYVIIGSFANENNARNYKQTMSDKGFIPVILENKTGYYRVAIFNSDDESAARQKIHDIRSKYSEHSDVWLLVKK